MGRVGLIRAVVEPVGRDEDATVVVRLLDAGADEKVVTHNLIGFAAAR